MARKRNEAPKPEDTTPLSLLRIEERVERVPITPEQAQERMAAAAGLFIHANAILAEAQELKEQAKDEKARGEAKREDAERIVIDAQNGTMAAPFGVIVERHPTHPAEMIIWRAPDGVAPTDLLALDAEGAERIAAREAQGCTMHENRAMSPEEMEIAKREDWTRANPELPFPELPFSEGQIVPPAPSGGGGTVLAFAPRSSAAAEEHAAARVIECPWIAAEHPSDPRLDERCTGMGASRRKGFCAEHYEATGGKEGGAEQARMLLRRASRRLLIEEAIKADQVAADDDRFGAQPPDEEPVADTEPMPEGERYEEQTDDAS